MRRYRNDSCPPAIMTCSCRMGIMMCGEVTPLAEPCPCHVQPGLPLILVARHAGHKLAISSMRQVLIIPIHGPPQASSKISIHKRERAYAIQSSKFLQILTTWLKQNFHKDFPERIDNSVRVYHCDESAGVKNVKSCCVATLATTPGNDQRASKIDATTSS